MGLQAGSGQLGASLFELPPSAASFELHLHHANVELIVVVSGRPTLRTLESEGAEPDPDAVDLRGQPD